MKYAIALCLLLTFILTGCGDSTTGETTGLTILDSTFVDANYRQTLDAIGQDQSLPKADREAIRGFIRRYRKRIPEGWTYGKILEAAKGMKQMRESAIDLQVLNFARREDLRIHEILMEVKFRNTLNQPIETVYGDLFFSDTLGRRLHASPQFVVQGPLVPGAETGLLRLQYAYERPTGNELNDPKKAAVRDTLEMLKDFAKHFDSSRVKFRVRDLLLEGNLSIEDYWLMNPDQRKAAAKPSPQSIPLLDWAKANPELVKGIATVDGNYFLSVRPVLTDGYESVHGPFLLFSRRLKVVKHFTQNLDVPGNNIDPGGLGSDLHSRHKVDFWNWPVELWIYNRAR